MRLSKAILCAFAMLAPIASAQLLPAQLPEATPLPRMPLAETADPLARALASGDDALYGYRRQLRDLLRSDPARIARTPRGDLMLRSEYLAIDAVDQALSGAAAAGFVVARRDLDDELGFSLTLLHDARSRSPARGLRALREAMPGIEVEFNHLYMQAGGLRPQAGGVARSQPAGDAGPRMRVGLIDGGVDATLPAFSRIDVRRYGCDDRAVPQRHGTQVATRLAGNATGTLYAADLWCGRRIGEGTLGLVDALRWMVRERVAVVNISLVGPDDRVLRRMIDAMHARGHVLVAAAGNDGPAAAPLFPAAYPGVIAVAAVDAKRRPLPESAAGAHIDVCAPGVIDATRDGRGTSFAAPLVARRVAEYWAAPAPGRADDALQRLERDIVDNGKPGRDPRCGAGVVLPGAILPGITSPRN